MVLNAIQCRHRWRGDVKQKTCGFIGGGWEYHQQNIKENILRKMKLNVESERGLKMKLKKWGIREFDFNKRQEEVEGNRGVIFLTNMCKQMTELE